MIYIKTNNELYHYGMPRRSGRYPYGSGERPYQHSAEKLLKNNVSSEQVYKKLKKQVRKTRSAQYGWSNRWMVHKPIGPESKKLVDEDNRRYKEYKSSPEFKAWEKKVDNLEKRYNKKYSELESTNFEKEMDFYAALSKLNDSYDESWKKIEKERPEITYNTLMYVKIYRPHGAEYLNDFINKGGKDLTVAYLKDLGYDNKDIEALVDKMIKENRTLGDV